MREPVSLVGVGVFAFGPLFEMFGYFLPRLFAIMGFHIEGGFFCKLQ